MVLTLAQWSNASMQDLITRNSSRLELALRALDTVLLLCAGQLASYLVFGATAAAAAPVHALLLVSCSGLAFLLLPSFGMYQSWRGRPLAAMLLRLVAAWAALLAAGLLLAFAAHLIGGLSRLWIASWFASGALLLAGARAAVHVLLRALRRQGWNGKRVLIVGYGRAGQEMHRRAAQQDWTGYEVCAILPDASEVPATLAAQRIDEVWITLPLSAAAELQAVQQALRDTLADVRWVPDMPAMQLLSARMIEFLGFPALELNRPRADGADGLAKELFDRLFAAAVLVILAPLFLGLALAVKFDSRGPVFYRQRRLGLNGRPFELLKFRSMHTDAGGAFAQATRDDPRVTRLGRFLRASSLDELPQFINVLLGDMSVVGPRPHALPHNEQFRRVLDQYMLRHRVKPGITGWAQIHGYRGETDTLDKMAMRVQFDLDYIRQWSLWMDLRIIAWTALRGWTGKNAY